MRHHVGLLVVFTAACNPSNTQDACYAFASAACHRIFDLSSRGCANATDFIAQQGFADESHCESSFEFMGWTCAQLSTNQCAAGGSPGPEYSGDRAGACASELGNLACDSDLELDSTADCPHVCCLPSGEYPKDASDCCSGKTHSIEVTGCGPTPFHETVCD